MALFTRTLTIGDLIEIDNQRKDRSRNLKVKYETTYTIAKEMNFFGKLLNFFRRGPKTFISKLIRYTVVSDSGSNYTVFVRVYPGFNEKKFLSNKVEVFCSCPDFMYRAAYNLNKSDNLVKIPATIDHLGEALKVAPTVVETTHICKHVYAVIEHLKTHLKDLELVIKK